MLTLCALVIRHRVSYNQNDETLTRNSLRVNPHIGFRVDPNLFGVFAGAAPLLLERRRRQRQHARVHPGNRQHACVSKLGPVVAAVPLGPLVRPYRPPKYDYETAS